MLFQEVDMVETRSIDTTDQEYADVTDFVVNLLDVNEPTRLGSGIMGSFDVKNHCYFKNINWRKIDAKELEPPHVMRSDELNDVPYYTTLDAMLKECGHDSWLKGNRHLVKVQKHFEVWNYSSPYAIVGEYEAKGKAILQKSAEALKRREGENQGSTNVTDVNNVNSITNATENKETI